MRRATLDLVSRIEWTNYLERFHSDRAGITETILSSCRADAITPYEWLGTLLVPGTRTVLDIACGSGPMRQIVGPAWFGVDRSRAELATARHAYREGRLTLADANALPFRVGCADTVVCCMGLMVIPSIETVLREITQVAARQARLAVLLPTTSPLTIRDRLRYARLLATLHITTFRYPNPAVIKDPHRPLHDAGFTATDDDRKRFSFQIADADAADALIDSFYVPGIHAERLDAAKRVARRWTGTDIGIPLRRLAARPT